MTDDLERASLAAYNRASLAAYNRMCELTGATVAWHEHDETYRSVFRAIIGASIESVLLNPSEDVVENVARALHRAHYERGRGLAPGYPSDRFEREMWLFSARAALRTAGLRILGREG